MALDLVAELDDWLASGKTREKLQGLVREAIRDELRSVLDGELLDVRQAAELLRMTPQAVYKAASRGTIPSTRLGGRLRFRRSELLASLGGAG